MARQRSPDQGLSPPLLFPSNCTPTEAPPAGLVRRRQLRRSVARGIPRSTTPTTYISVWDSPLRTAQRTHNRMSCGAHARGGQSPPPPARASQPLREFTPCWFLKAPSTQATCYSTIRGATALIATATGSGFSGSPYSRYVVS